MEATIHPDALRALRKKRGWNQKELAKRSKISPETISRWERGKTRKVRKHSLDRLTEVLNVDSKELARAPIDEDQKPRFGPPTVQLNVRIQARYRNALRLVCLRYGLRPTEVIELAPLLFLITAEKSLAHRRESLSAIEKNRDQIAKESKKAAPHLACAFNQSPKASEAISCEKESINRRDLFGWGNNILMRYNIENRDPFVNYLRILLADLPSELVNDLNPRNGYGPDYTVAWDTMCEETALSGDNENEKRILRGILEGHIDLNKVLSAKDDRPREEYLTWLSDQLEAAERNWETGQRDAFERAISDLEDMAIGGIE